MTASSFARRMRALADDLDAGKLNRSADSQRLRLRAAELDDAICKPGAEAFSAALASAVDEFRNAAGDVRR